MVELFGGPMDGRRIVVNDEIAGSGVLIVPVMPSLPPPPLSESLPPIEGSNILRLRYVRTDEEALSGFERWELVP